MYNIVFRASKLKFVFPYYRERYFTGTCFHLNIDLKCLNPMSVKTRVCYISLGDWNRYHCVNIPVESYL